MNIKVKSAFEIVKELTLLFTWQ